MRVRRLTRGLASCILALAACSASHRAALRERPSPPPCQKAHPPCPPFRDPINLTAEEKRLGNGIVLDTPPATPPAISAEFAVDIAWHQATGPALDATAIQPIYATYRSLHAATPERWPVWVLQFEGSCTLLYGGPSAGCVDQPLNSVVNAQTGEWAVHVQRLSSGHR